MNIEKDLQRALSRKAAPHDLADRVLAQIAAERPGSGGRPLQHLRGWLAAAAAVVLVASGAARYYAYQQEAAEAERVTEEVRIALQITSEVFSRAQQRILDAGNEPSNQRAAENR
jgi:hypothetical protein